ncbi:MAG: ARMT1-like domain-containing protein [Candidatus Omnitrophica bacterium]|nr:ARMT1-like domain-containing protein [Candidatus Omnitrophota bacterium]
MKTYLDCIPCFFKQALEAAVLSGADNKRQKKILDAVGMAMPELPLSASPPEVARVIHSIVKKITAQKDPYAKIKEKSNKLSLKFYPKMKKKIARSQDSLLTAVELAIAGNIIDYGVKNSINVERELDRIMNEERSAIKKERKSIFNYPGFKVALKKAKNILYLADNSGEVVFDRVLIEEIKKFNKNAGIVYAVKEKPIINDALLKDALIAGIQKYARIISSGADAPGTVLSLCSKYFLNKYRSADMIISKGQGNFEALSDSRRPIFFLFMAKCPVVTRHMKCNLGAIILLANPKCA